MTPLKPKSVQERGEHISASVFTGGPVERFAEVGAMQLATLLLSGLQPNSLVLDVGCGALRGGYWLLHFLNPDCYYGLEPNREMLEAGLRDLIEEDVLRCKRPQFDHNDRFDFSVFGRTFDFVLARSMWTHASKAQIDVMLDQFVTWSSPTGCFLTSYRPAFPRQLRALPALIPALAENMPPMDDYRDDVWIGRSHQSSEAGMVQHSYRWIVTECRARRLKVRQLRYPVAQGQYWLQIRR